MTNVAMVALEELGGEDDGGDVAPAPIARRPAPPHARGTEQAATDPQRRALLARAHALSHVQEAAEAFLRARLGCEPARAGRGQASRLLAALDAELAALRLHSGRAPE